MAGLSNKTRRFPPPWSIEDDGACFIVKDSAGQLAYVYFEDEPERRRPKCRDARPTFRHRYYRFAAPA
jgi:hypothetical protein